MHSQKSGSNHFVLSFDLPRDYSTPRVRIFRRLKGMGAKMVHESFWSHHDLKTLIEIAMMVKSFGGKASILEERMVF